MPKISVKESFECEHCGRVFPRIEQAAACEAEHELIYIPIERGDLKRIIQIVFFSNMEPELVTPTLSRTLQKYNKLRGES